MSQENVEIVRSIYEAFNRREWDAVFRDTAPDVELTTPPGGPNSGTYRGREECEGYLRELITPFEASALHPEEFFERGDQVAVVYKVRQQRRNRDSKWGLVDDPGRQGSIPAIFLQARGGPRSRRAAGVAALDEKQQSRDKRD
jgi:ketosteroid isomerase-like protein